jgi:hypothetical protein
MWRLSFSINSCNEKATLWLSECSLVIVDIISMISRQRQKLMLWVFGLPLNKIAQQPITCCHLFYRVTSRSIFENISVVFWMSAKLVQRPSQWQVVKKTTEMLKGRVNKFSPSRAWDHWLTLGASRRLTMIRRAQHILTLDQCHQTSPRESQLAFALFLVTANRPFPPRRNCSSTTVDVSKLALPRVLGSHKGVALWPCRWWQIDRLNAHRQIQLLRPLPNSLIRVPSAVPRDHDGLPKALLQLLRVATLRGITLCLCGRKSNSKAQIVYITKSNGSACGISVFELEGLYRRNVRFVSKRWKTGDCHNRINTLFIFLPSLISLMLREKTRIYHIPLTGNLFNNALKKLPRLM